MKKTKKVQVRWASLAVTMLNSFDQLDYSDNLPKVSEYPLMANIQVIENTNR